VHDIDPTRGAIHGGGQWHTPRPYPGPSNHAFGMFPTSTPIYTNQAPIGHVTTNNCTNMIEAQTPASQPQQRRD
jgi:hypothetical protein